MAAEKNRRSISSGPVVFLAGFTFLVFEVCWNRQLALALGATVTASTIVLATFMAGFGLGALFWGRYADRGRRPGRVLALLLAGVGLFGAAAHFVFLRAVPLLGTAPAPAVHGALALFLLAPVFLMGGVFPVASRIAARRGGALASALGRLYAFETAGSATGGLLAGFLLLGVLGQRNTALLAAAIDIALAAWLLVAEWPGRAASRAPRARPSGAPGRGAAAAPRPMREAALVGTFACGFSMLALQVVHLRIFRVYLINTSYTFALIASLVVLGLFTGSAIFARRSALIADHRRSLVKAMAGLALSAAVGLVLLVRLPQVVMFPLQPLFDSPSARLFLLPLVAALPAVFPAALFSGYAFPLACRIFAGTGERVGRDVGLVLMVNTLGSAAGPLVATFVLLPRFGAALTGLAVVALLALSALAVLLRAPARPGSPRPARALRYGLCALAAALAALFAVRPEIRILPPSFARFDREILFYRESVEGTLTVGRDRGTKTDAKYTYVNNSAVIGSSYDAVKVVKMVGHLPFFLGLRCRDALVIGFGVGVTTSAIASHGEVESIECVELVRGLKEAAVYYRELNGNVANDRRLTFIAGDGRCYLQRTRKKYNLISCDPTHPILGSGNLYTRDYFALCREHLNPGGMVSQYLPLHKLRLEELLGIVATFHAEFPHCTVWLGNFHAVLLGSLDPIEVDFRRWMEAVGRAGEDRFVHMEGRHLAATLALDEAAIASLAEDRPINTDDRSYTEFFTPACLDEGNLAENLAFFVENRSAPGAVFRDIVDEEAMSRFSAGNRLLTESLYHRFRGDNRRSLAALREACRVNPEDPEYPFLIQLYF